MHSIFHHIRFVRVGLQSQELGFCLELKKRGPRLEGIDHMATILAGILKNTISLMCDGDHFTHALVAQRKR